MRRPRRSVVPIKEGQSIQLCAVSSLTVTNIMLHYITLYYADIIALTVVSTLTRNNFYKKLAKH